MKSHWRWHYVTACLYKVKLYSPLSHCQQSLSFISPQITSSHWKCMTEFQCRLQHSHWQHLTLWRSPSQCRVGFYVFLHNEPPTSNQQYNKHTIVIVHKTCTCTWVVFLHYSMSVTGVFLDLLWISWQKFASLSGYIKYFQGLLFWSYFGHFELSNCLVHICDPGAQSQS